MRLSSADGRKRCAARRCSVWFQPRKTGGKPQRFCSVRCQKREHRYRTGKRQLREFGTCKHGHVRTPENTGWSFKAGKNGGKMVRWCRVCDRISQRKRYQLRREHRNKLHKDYYLRHREEILAKRKARYFQQKLELICS